MKSILLLIALLISAANVDAAKPSKEKVKADATAGSKWHGKKVGFLGDSMTDPRRGRGQEHWWSYLRQLIGIEDYVFARSGYRWDKMLPLAEQMRDSVGTDLAAIFIWCGTNDFNGNKPIGEFFTEATEVVNVNGQDMPRKHRVWNYTEDTYTGSINRTLRFLKENYPDTQIYIMTPIHRGFASFNEKNVQQDEDYANALGLYIEDYVDMLKLAAAYWSVPVIDLYGESGIYPNLRSNDDMIAKPDTDRLHPSEAGHYRVARIIQDRLPDPW